VVDGSTKTLQKKAYSILARTGSCPLTCPRHFSQSRYYQARTLSQCPTPTVVQLQQEISCRKFWTAILKMIDGIASPSPLPLLSPRLYPASYPNKEVQCLPSSSTPQRLIVPSPSMRHNLPRKSSARFCPSLASNSHGHKRPGL
jgi:hypothetical protein